MSRTSSEDEPISRLDSDTITAEGVAALTPEKVTAVRWVLIGIMVAVVIIFVRASLIDELNYTHIATPLFGLVALTGYWLLARQKIRTALLITTWGCWSLVTVQCFVVNGLATPIIMGYPLFMFLTGWLLTRRDTLLLLIATLTAIVTIALSSHFHWLPSVPRSPTQYLITQVAIILLCWILANGTTRSFTSRFNRVLQLKEDLQTRLDELVRSEQKFTAMFSLSPQPIALSRLSDGVFLDCNAAWCEAFGWSREAIIGHSSLELGIWADPAERSEWITQLQRDGRTLPNERHLKGANGHSVTGIASAAVIHDRGLPCVLTMLVDITQRLQAEGALHQLNAELEERVNERSLMLEATRNELLQSEKLASLGSMVAGVSHELNTPIGNALMTVTTLKEQLEYWNERLVDGQIKRSELNDFVRSGLEAARLAERALNRSGELVRSFKQTAADQISEQRRSFDLKEIVEDTLLTLRPQYKRDPWQFVVDLPEGILFDSLPGPLEQIIINLTHNATRHGFEGKTLGTVRYTTDPTQNDEHWATLVVSDDGVGIPAENLARIFDPFFTTKMGRGGTGIGLTIAHRLTTTVLSGRIEVGSVVNQGTRVTLKLPRVLPEKI